MMATIDIQHTQDLAELFVLALGKLFPSDTVQTLVHTYPKGSVMLWQDKVPKRVLLITEGLAASRMLLANGKEVLIAIHGHGVTLGDLEYFTLGTPAACEVKALEDSRCMAVDYPTMARMLRVEPGLGEAFAGLIARRLYRSSRRMSTSIAYPLEYNLLQALLARLDGHQPLGLIEDAMDYSLDLRPLTRKDLAEYLGHSERHINRVLRALAEEGIVSLDSQMIHAVEKERASQRLLELED